MAQELISGWLYIEYLVLGGNANNPTDWVRVTAADTPCTARMARGVGACATALSYVFPAAHPSQGRPHRACIDLDAPKDFDPLCTTFASKTKAIV